MALMVAAVLTTDTSQQQTFRHLTVPKYWEDTQTVQKAEKELECSSVKITLFEEKEYKIGEWRHMKTNQVIGLVKDNELYSNVEEIDAVPEVKVYNVSGNVIFTLREYDIKEMDVYKGGELQFTRISDRDRCYK